MSLADPSRKTPEAPPPARLYVLFLVIGAVLLVAGAGVLYFTFRPVIGEEIRYQMSQPDPNKEITPVDSEFGIVIPALGANAKVVANVDPHDSAEYQRMLTFGVAHAKGTPYPGESGNVFLFAHSAGNFYEANRYNAIFYLISKLNPGDEIQLYYKNEKFTYRVTETKIVRPSEVKYLSRISDNKTVTLMTCWPAGTTLNRLLVIGEITAD